MTIGLQNLPWLIGKEVDLPTPVRIDVMLTLPFFGTSGNPETRSSSTEKTTV